MDGNNGYNKGKVYKCDKLAIDDTSKLTDICKNSVISLTWSNYVALRLFIETQLKDKLSQFGKSDAQLILDSFEFSRMQCGILKAKKFNIFGNFQEYKKLVTALESNINLKYYVLIWNGMFNLFTKFIRHDRDGHDGFGFDYALFYNVKKRLR